MINKDFDNTKIINMLLYQSEQFWSISIVIIISIGEREKGLSASLLIYT